MPEWIPRHIWGLPAVLVGVLGIALSAPARGDSAEPQELLKNPRFQPPYAVQPAPTGKGQVTGQIAAGWADNSDWADVTVNYSQSAEGAHGGCSAQKIEVKDVRGDHVQFVQEFPVQRGHVYALSVWLRGTPDSVVSLLLRQAPSPYTAYQEKAIILDDTWRQVKITALALDAGDAFFMVLISAAATVYVDDASALDMTGAVSGAPRIAGNLLPDSSFEAGLGAGWSVRCESYSACTSTALEFVDPRPALDAAAAADRKRSIRATLPCAGFLTITSPLVPYNYGRRHTASIWLKASMPGASARLELLGATESQFFPLTTSWERCALTTVIPYGEATRLTVTAATPEAASGRANSCAGTIWFGAAELREEGQEAPAAGEPPQVELTLRCDRPGGVFFDGEAALLRVASANAPEAATLRASVLDLYGHASQLRPQPASQKQLIIAPDAAPQKRGVFKVTAQLFSPGGAAVSPPVQQVFARLPHPREIDPEKSFFGVHVPLAQEYIQIARAIGARWCRIHDASWATKWPVVEPRPGEFVFYDEEVEAVTRAGIKILGMLDGGPVWASVKPRATSGYFSNYNEVDAPDAQAEWRNYVEKVVSHYRGKINHWEVWNEPWGGTFSPGPPERYGKLLREAYPVARQANPDVVIVGIDTERGMDEFTEWALKACGGSNSYDAFSYHDYYSALYGGPNPQPARDAAAYRAFQLKYGQARPVWMTEGAPAEGIQSFYWPLGQEQATRSQLARTIRFDVTLMAAGVQHSFYYTLHADPPEGEFTLTALEHDRTIRPLLAARAVLASLVDGAECLGRSEPVAGVDCYGFRQADGKRIDVLWSHDGRPHTVAAPKEAEVLDALGNPLAANVDLGREPVYFVR
jgi:hypothetical protein